MPPKKIDFLDTFLSGFQMVRRTIGILDISDHKTEGPKQTLLVRFSDHLSTRHVLTICIRDLSGIQIVTVVYLFPFLYLTNQCFGAFFKGKYRGLIKQTMISDPAVVAWR